MVKSDRLSVESVQSSLKGNTFVWFPLNSIWIEQTDTVMVSKSDEIERQSAEVALQETKLCFVRHYYTSDSKLF